MKDPKHLTTLQRRILEVARDNPHAKQPEIAQKVFDQAGDELDLDKPPSNSHISETFKKVGMTGRSWTAEDIDDYLKGKYSPSRNFEGERRISVELSETDWFRLVTYLLEAGEKEDQAITLARTITSQYLDNRESY